MKVVIEYALSQFLKYFLMLIAIFVFVYLLIDFLDRIDNYIEYRSTFYEILLFYVYRLPFILLQVMAMSVLLAGIVTLSLMNRNNEITALKAAGISIYRLSVPFILLGLFISLITFSLAEGVVPYANAKATQLWRFGMRHHEDVNQGYTGKLKGWYRSDRAIFNIRRLKSENLVEGASLFFFDENYKLIRRIEAKEGRYEKGRWIFYNGLDKSIGEDGNFLVKRFDDKEVLLAESPESFKYISKSADEMSLVELDSYIKQLESEGYETTSYRVDRMVKFTLPFVPVVLIILAVPIALRYNREAGIAQPVGTGVAVAFAYIVFFGLSRSLGLAGAIPIFLSAWLPNAVFGLIGAYLLLSLKQ